MLLLLGSGKTAVLVERIINKIIVEKIDIDKLLVVTFTNAAAAEMRERVLDAIYKKLEEDPENENLQRQVTLLNKASICTIDSFCLEVVRNNFFELDNLSPNFRIGDTTEIELLKQEVIEEIFEQKYEEENDNFTKLINIYTSYRDDTPLKDLVLKIYSYIQSNPFPEKWLKEKIEMFDLSEKLDEDFSNTPWGEVLLQEVEEELIDDISTLEKVEEDLSFEPELDKFQQTIRNDIEQLEVLKRNLANWDKSCEIAKNISFVSWPRQKVESELKEFSKKTRDDVKKKLNKVLDKILICDSKEANQDIYDMYKILIKLEDLILEFGKEFSKRKREKNIVDFNDVEHFALSILLKTNEDGSIEKSEIAKKYQNKYTEIAIDEYQDSNLVQEYILTAVSKQNNIFMVGDVKQSIYKFRQAMPELFLRKYSTYCKKENRAPEQDLKIQLFKNFRSKQNILEFTNLIFENIMSNLLGDIEYNQEEYLNLGANYPKLEQETKNKQNEKTEIYILNITKQDICENQEEGKEKTSEANNIESEFETNEGEEIERIEDIELEARFVANKIKKLIDDKFQVWDKKENKYRDIKYKDIVILLRATSNLAPIYEQEMLNLDMPVFSDSSQEYLDSIEIQTIMSLLKIIDNPIQDIPLVTVLRSNIGKFTDDELIQIRLADKNDDFYTCMQKARVSVTTELKEKIESFFNNLIKWRKEQEYLALDELIWKIYSDTGYYNYVGLMPNGELRQANLKMLFERAKQYETASFKGLYNFIHFIEKLSLSSGDLGSAKIIGENDNVIRIMSIHKSKGLEFPVVFLSSTGKQFNLMDLNQDILLHQELGIGVKYIDYEKQVQYDTLTKASIKNKILTETLSEEMRILYVALTRAKEKLIITGIKKDYEKEIEKIEQQVERYKKKGTKINPILVKKYKKYLDWILLVYLYEKNNINEIIDLYVVNKKDAIRDFKEIEKEEVDIREILEADNKNNTNKSNIEKIDEKNDYKEEKIKEIEKELNYQYKHFIATKIPTKTSVTKIKQIENAYREYRNKENEETIVDLFEIGNEKKQEIIFDIPKFMKKEEKEKLTGAQKGTLVHLCMQRLNAKQEYTREDVKKLIQDLVFKEIITEVEAENININVILNFTKSNIWTELKNAKEIYKEKPFYINLAAKEIYHEETEEDILAQGIIDLYYINQDDELVLVDYKTDFVEDGKENELVSKYQKQLDLYKKALEDALNRQVDKVYIYSTWLGKEIKI